MAGTERMLECQLVIKKGMRIRRRTDGYVRYYENVLRSDGNVERVQRAKSIAPICYEYRTQRSVMPVVTEILSAVDDNHLSPEGTLKLEQFVEENYLTHVASQKRPSA